MNALVKYFSFFRILLICGCSQLPAHASGENILHSPMANLVTSEQSGDDATQKTFALIANSTLSDGETLFFKVEATVTEEVEEEDEHDHELSSFRKNLKNSNYFAAIFCTQALDYYFDGKKISTFYSRLSRSSSPRQHVIFQVFRL